MLAGLNDSCSAVTPEGTAPTMPSIDVSTATNSLATPPHVTSAAISHFDSSCWPLKTLEESNAIQGSFIFANYPGRSIHESNGIFVWDISSFRSVELIGASGLKLREGSYISPGGNFIANLSDKNLTLVSRDGIQLYSLPKEGELIRAYLADGRILFVNKQNRRSNYREGVGLTETYYILDPATGETTKHVVFLPNFQIGSHEVFIIQYSPDMKYVLYRSTSGEDDIKFTLYDLEKNRVIWVGPSRDANLVNSAWSVPGWQADSSALTALYLNLNTDQVNYYSISLDGDVSPLTNFNGVSLYNTTQPNPSWWSGYAEPPNWSPDGRYLVSSGVQNGDNLLDGTFMFVWDNHEKTGYKPCLPNERQRIFPHLIAWSYDGFYFMVTLTFMPSPSSTDIVLPGYISKSYILDLANKVIYEIPDENNRGEFATLYKGGVNEFLGWVNWEIP